LNTFKIKITLNDIGEETTLLQELLLGAAAIMEISRSFERISASSSTTLSGSL